jgi:hypothetical protein
MHGKYNWITAEIRKSVTLKSEGKCYWCKKKALKAEISPRGIPILFDENGDVFHIDHITPVKDGGEEIIDNLVIACKNCNLSKRKRIAENNNEIIAFLRDINGE